MKREEFANLVAILIIVGGVLFGFAFFHESKSSTTGNVVANNQVQAPAEKQVGTTCSQKCIAKGCFGDTVSYLGYNLNICSCSRCADTTQKSFYCHGTVNGNEDMVCDWQNT